MTDRNHSLVIFDIDGTLLDTVDDHIGAFLEALDLFALSNIDSRWDLYPEHTDSAILHELFQVHRGRRATSDELEAFGRRLAQAFDARTSGLPLRLISGAEALLAAISSDPFLVCALATGGLREVSIPKVARLAPYIEPDAVVTASDAESRENILARAIALCVEQTGMTFDRVTYVGDGAWDAIAARGLDLSFIGVGPSIDRFRGECAENDFVGSLDSTRLLEELGLFDHQPEPPSEGRAHGFMHAGDERLELRRYRSGDLDEVMRLHNVALDQFGANAGPGPWDVDLDNIPAHYFDRGEFIVGSLEGRLVAMGAVRRVTNETAELKRMRVLPDRQRRGFGGQILAALEETAKGLGYSKLVLDTMVIQEPAQAFYRKQGYTETRRDLSRSPAIVFFEKEL